MAVNLRNLGAFFKGFKGAGANKKMGADAKDLGVELLTVQIAKSLSRVMPDNFLKNLSQYEAYILSVVPLIANFAIRRYTHWADRGDAFVTQVAVEISEDVLERYKALQKEAKEAAAKGKEAPKTETYFSRSTARRNSKIKKDFIWILMNDKKNKGRGKELLKAFNSLFKDRKESEKNQIFQLLDVMNADELITFLLLDETDRNEWLAALIDKEPDMPVTEDDHWKKLKEHLDIAKKKFMAALEKADDLLADNRVIGHFLNKVFKLKPITN